MEQNYLPKNLMQITHLKKKLAYNYGSSTKEARSTKMGQEKSNDSYMFLWRMFENLHQVKSSQGSS